METILFRVKRKIRTIYRRCVRAIIGLHKRDKNLIVYGGALDLFIDNAKHLFIYNNGHMPSRRHVWLSNNDDVLERVRSLGFEACKSSTREGKRLMKNAGMVIYDYKIDEFSYHTLSQGAIRLELWHGVPYCKLIGHAKVDQKTPYTIKSNFKFKYFMEHIYGDYVLSTSVNSNIILSAAFDVPVENLVISDYPRCRYMFMNDDQIEKYIMRYEDKDCQVLYDELKKQQDCRKVIYMPTFRDANPGYLSDAFPNWADFNDFCSKNNIMFYVKVHRVTPLPKERDFSNIRFLDSHLDMYPILGQFDLLVTDYSSIMYEFALLNKPILLYTFDMDDYIEHSREIHTSFLDLLRELTNAGSYTCLKNILSDISDSFVPFPNKGYFDCPGDISSIIKFIESHTKN